MPKTILKNAECVLPEGIKKVDIMIEFDRIIEIGEDLTEKDARVFDLTGKTVLPGIIDTQVHFRDPGLTYKEDLESGSRAALMGGVTHFLEMPNTKPSTTNFEKHQEKVSIAKYKSHTRFGFFLGATAENLRELKVCHNWECCCGIKIFLGSSTGDLLLYDDQKLLEIFKECTGMIACHSENEERLAERKEIQQKATSAHQHPVWRDEETAYSSTKKLLELAREAGRKVHVLHITTKEEMELLAKNKDVCTVEVTPQHLTLAAPECYDELGTYAQMNPPIRDAHHREALWEGIANGTVDVIGSDHAPHTKKEKDEGYPASPAGMPGVQTTLPIMLDHVNNGKLSLEKLVDLLCHNPAKLYDIKEEGCLKVGNKADITIVDMNKEWTVTNEEMAYKCQWTPFHGKKLKGKQEMVFIGGRLKMKDDNILT